MCSRSGATCPTRSTAFGSTRAIARSTLRDGRSTSARSPARSAPAGGCSRVSFRCAHNRPARPSSSLRTRCAGSSPHPSRSSARSRRCARRGDGRGANGWSSHVGPARDTLHANFFRGGARMTSARSILAIALALVTAVASTWAPRADAQGQTIKIGILFDHTGPFSAAGSLNCWRGAKMIIDYVTEKGGVLGKYKIVQVDGDSQSKADVAINEAERLLNVEKVDILAGVYSSAHAVPLAAKIDAQKKIFW